MSDAKSKNTSKKRALDLQNKWSKNKRTKLSVEKMIASGNDAGMKTIFGASGFDAGMKEAYSQKEGYTIKVNPITGEKEMFIAGTRDTGQWMLNVFDIVGARVDIPRKKRVAQYESIARAEGVDVIYGHSRAAALVSDMNVPGATKVGVDGAMLLAYQDKGMANFHEGGPTGVFDEIIAAGGKNNKRMNLGHKIHSVWN
jgi:hypothetical protein